MKSTPPKKVSLSSSIPGSTDVTLLEEEFTSMIPDSADFDAPHSEVLDETNLEMASLKKFSTTGSIEAPTTEDSLIRRVQKKAMSIASFSLAPQPAPASSTAAKKSSSKKGPDTRADNESESGHDDKSSFGGGDSPEDFRKELERLQIATIYSLVEEVPTKNGGKLNLLFLTNRYSTLV